MNSSNVQTVSLYESQKKIYPRSVTGRFVNWRWALVWITQLVFYVTPWLQWNDRQAVLFDLGARRFYIFGLVLYPQDFIYLTGLLIVAAYSTLRLVEWRYQAEDADNPGVVSHPPGTIMAVVFVVFILVDALTRAFMFDPAERTSIGRRWKGRYTRTVDWWLLRRESAALARWQKRWFSAMTLVEKLKNGADQELLTATVSILISRGDKGSDGSQLHGWPAESVPGARVADGAQLMSKVTHTTGAPAEQLNESNAHIFLQHRLVRLAEARLEIIKPPEDPQQERREPTEDLTQFERPTRPEARDPEPAPPPHNMSQIGPEGIAS